MSSQPVSEGRAYRLHGPQVEPTSSFWLDEPRIRVPGLSRIRRYTRSSSNARLFLDPALFPDDAALAREFAFIDSLEPLRDNVPYPIVQLAGPPLGDFSRLTELSAFIHLKPPPFGAIFDSKERTQTTIETVVDQHLRILDQRPIVREGRELARMFEEETPGIYHRHALNWLLFLRPTVSPPRQARIWMGLDMAIYTALSAAWYFKWRSRFRGLLRPSEYATRMDKKFEVHFDHMVNAKGHDEQPGARRECPTRPEGSEKFHPDSPGSPRHPAWPSGHSTYSAAATYMMEYFFSPDSLAVPDGELFERYKPGEISRELLIDPGWIAAELRRLANNIGEARLWGGVHWISDHVAGQRIGRSAAQAVIDTFLEDTICPFEEVPCDNDNLQPPPDDAELERQWEACQDDPDPRQDFVPQPTDPDRQALAARGAPF